MSDIAFLIDTPDQLTLDAGDATQVRSRVQVAKTGSFEDPRYGKFSITPADLRKWMANFQTLSVSGGRMGLPIDVDHSPEKKGTTEAAGWVKSLDTMGPDGKTPTPGELWADVEWNVLGQELIREHRYAYLSPSYQHNYRDENGRAHGTALVGVGLTNRPFLQMATVSLSKVMFATEVDAEDVLLDEYSAVDDDAWTLADLTTKDRKALPKSSFVFPEKAPGSGSYPIPDIEHARNALARSSGKPEEGAVKKAVYARYPALRPESYTHSQMPDLKNIALSLGLAEDADEATILDAIGKKADDKPTVPEGKVMLDQGTVDKLLADAAAGATAAEALRVQTFEAAFTTALDAGKVTPAQKDTFRAVYDADSEHALKLLDELEVKVNVVPAGSGAPVGDTPEARALAKDFVDHGAIESLPVDTEALQLHAATVALSQARNISYEDALALAEQGVTA